MTFRLFCFNEDFYIIQQYFSDVITHRCAGILKKVWPTVNSQVRFFIVPGHAQAQDHSFYETESLCHVFGSNL